MVRVEREPIWAFEGCAPSGVQGESPCSGIEGKSPPEAGEVFIFQSLIFDVHVIL